MKKSILRILTLEISFLFLLFFSRFGLNIHSNWYFIFSWGIFSLILKFLIGFEKDKSLKKIDFLMDVFIYCFLFWIFEYLLGLHTGYLKSPYHFGFSAFFKNIVPITLLILLEEFSRYMILSKGKKDKTVLFFCLLLFFSFDVITSFGIYDLTTRTGIFNTIILVLLPSLSKNILLTYLTDVSGYFPSILYRLILEGLIYVVPVYADLGEYVDSIFQIVFPLLLLYIFIRRYRRKEQEDIRNKNRNRWISAVLLFVTFTVLSLLVMLVSGYFKYYLLVIGSGSMEPNLHVGDVIILEQYFDSSKLEELKKGDILVYQHEKKVIVHRIVEIDKIEDTYLFRTKGDNNETEDNWIIYGEQIIGVARKKIKYLGYPTVYFNELLDR